MSYTNSSQLEREARSKGDPLIWQAFFRSYVDSDANVRNKCYSILTENPEGAKQPALEKLVEKGGVWIERDVDFFHIHGMRDQIGDRSPYTLSWRRGLIRQEESPANFFFTEAQLLSHLYGRDEYIPSAKQFDGTLRALQTARAHGKQRHEIENTISGLSDYFQTAMHTSTHIESGTLIHGWGRPNPQHTELPRSQGAIAEVETTMHLLGTTDMSPQIHQRYALLSSFAPIHLEIMLSGDVHVMITGGGNNPVRYYTASDVNTMGVARLVKKTPITKPN